MRPRFSLGLEGGALGNEEYNAGRGGGFARVNFRAMEVTLSGGFTGNYLEDEPSCYVALGLYGRSEIMRVATRLRPKCTAGPAPAVLGLFS